MNPTVILSTVLTLVLVAMFAFGLYSLGARYGSHQVPSSPAPAAGTTASSFAANRAHAASSAFAASNPDEWEANAHWSEHNVQTDTHDRDELRQSPGSFGERTSPNIEDARHELHEALASETDDTSESFAFAPRTSAAPSSSPSSGSIQRCPQCSSARINTLNRARKAGSTLGSVAGATSGMAMALSGAEAGAVVGSFVGPIGTVFGGLAGAVIAGLVGSAAGCAAGSAVGAAIDDNVLDNHVCLSCGHAFSKAH